jgi:hypothetical protein
MFVVVIAGENRFADVVVVLPVHRGDDYQVDFGSAIIREDRRY